jgi:hypothetical protein
MIYVRSKFSIQLFPRASLALFLLFQIYFCSFVSGFHGLALLAMFVLLIWLMLFCLRNFEVPAFSSGAVSFDQPRYEIALSHSN